MQQTRTPITAPHLPAAGPYSHAVDSDGLIHLSGQTPFDPQTGALHSGDIGQQTEQVFRNLAAVLAAAGLGFEHVIKSTVFLTDMADFAAMNAVYARHFAPPYPARSTIGVKALPLGAAVEIEMVARRPG